MQRGRRTLFHEVSVQAAPGTLLQILGPNGTGKTTLLRGLCGLAPLRSGWVTWGDTLLHGTRAGDSPDQTPESAHHAPPSTTSRSALLFAGHLPAVKAALTAAENLALLAFMDGGPTGREAHEQALQRVGLGHCRRIPVGRFSQGQLRRLVMARLLLCRQPVWLLDEPLTALDQEGVARLMDIIAEHLQRGHVCIASTHRPFDDLLPDATRLQTLRLGNPDQAERHVH